MGSGYPVVLVILAALVAANLPFFSERRFMVFPAGAQRKSLAWHVAELLTMYLLTGALGLGFEQHAGQIYPQGWEFYAITAALFLTLAFPGFVYRFLLHRH